MQFRKIFEPIDKPLWQYIADLAFGILFLYWAWEWRDSPAWCVLATVLGVWEIQSGAIGAIRYLKRRTSTEAAVLPEKRSNCPR